MSIIHDSQKTYKDSILKNVSAGRTHDPYTPEDQKIIADYTSMMRQSYAGQMMLDWAKTQKSEIWIDPNRSGRLGNTGGYYFTGSNTAVLTKPVRLYRIDKYTRHIQDQQNARACNTIAHELTHAWQDHQFLLPYTIDNINLFYMRGLLAEAAAYAIGRTCQHEIEHDKTLDRQDFHKRARMEFNTYFLIGRPAVYEDSYTRTIIKLVLDEEKQVPRRYEYGLFNKKYYFNAAAQRPHFKNIDDVITAYGRLPDGENFLLKKGVPHIAPQARNYIFKPIQNRTLPKRSRDDLQRAAQKIAKKTFVPG